MSQIPSVPLPRTVPHSYRLDANGHIDEDVTCRKCGYNLRGLSAQGVCPECGTAVGRSLMGDLLRFSDPRWVRSLATGMDWILIGVIVAVLSSCLLGMALAAAGLPKAYASVWQVIVSVIPLVGYWKLTVPDPAGLEESRLNKYRRIVRVTTVVNILGGPLQLLLPIVGPIVVGILGSFLGLNYLVSTFAIFGFSRLMALRIPDERLARSTRALMWCSVITLLLLICMLVFVAINAPTLAAPVPSQGFATSAAYNFGSKSTSAPAPTPTVTSVPHTTGLAITGCSGMVLGLVVFIWSIILFFRYRGAFHEAALLALQSWASPRPQTANFGPGVNR